MRRVVEVVYPTISRLYTIDSAVMGKPTIQSGPRKDTGIPRPTGEQLVGCVDLMHQFKGDECGGLLVRLFYPAQPKSYSHSHAHWTTHDRYIQAYLEFQRTWGPGMKAASIKNPYLNPRIPALLEVDLLPSNDLQNNVSGHGTSHNHPVPVQFPVIVYCHGLGGMRCDNTSICCDFASHGYVVAAIEHRDHSACTSLQRVPASDSTPERPQFRDEWIDYHPNTAKEFPLRNKQVLQRSREAILALELLTMLNEGLDVNNMMDGNFNFKQFQGRLDVRKAAIMGHSFGGATTIQALSQDQRFLCGIAMDCWMLPLNTDILEDGISQPLLFINSSDFQWTDNVRKMTRVAQSPHSTNTTIITLKGTSHGNQCDIPFLPLFSELWSQFKSTLDPYKAFQVNLDICYAFLNRHLLKDPLYLQHIPDIDGGKEQSPHILFGTNFNLTTPQSKL